MKKVIITLGLLFLLISPSISQVIDESYFSSMMLGKENIDAWTEVLPDIWGISHPNCPIYVKYNYMYLYQVYELEASDASWNWTGDSLYVFPVDNPENIKVYKETGGRSISTGDFNGDLLPDIATITSTDSFCYIYFGNSEFSTFPSQIINAHKKNTYIASVGDVNGDGYDDLLMSLWWEINEVYLYFGSEEGIDESSKITLTDYSNSGFGHEISKKPGDINGDGYDDLLIGGTGPKTCYLYYGNADGLFLNPDHQILFPLTSSLNTPLSFVGDLNNDDFDDFAVSLGNKHSDNIISVIIYYGSSIGPDTLNSQLIDIFYEESRPINCDLYISKAEDVNNDGIDDLILGDQYKDGLYDHEGAVYVFYGSTEGINHIPDVIIHNPIPEDNDRFGNELDGVGDVNNDGFNDIAIGSPYANKAFVYYGSPVGISNTCYTAFHNQNYNYFGWSVTSAGNIYDDGKNYFLIGEEIGNSILYVYDSPQTQIQSDLHKSALENNALTIYPNPASNYISIDYDQSPIETVKIFSTDGIKLIEEKQKNTINIRRLNKGLYFVQITTDKGQLLVGKFIKY
ncbi:MAG: hypothetical protein A2W91_08665 [Bacteroidetes bacterium GWF2_38_335]|nr:MAG: hypothetical protein A2W91_08665 [Bacteroidetes bacterium GWF2_38_335]OFY80447.1 MAG: hypothetical protein A2281_08390 [Bacteroidetes bacterium RIFOXYA12_FULL_38_20]HBS85948.1 hypothetical protein [Bacteroidales bacterium]